MMKPLDLVFRDAQLEKRFAQFIAEDISKERGGILFYTYDQVVKMHWRMHERIFGTRMMGIITDWIIVPNVSNLPDRLYEVSDIRQMIAIAELTAKTRGCYAMHFHTHPSGNARKPSSGDLEFWWEHFNPYGHWTEAAIAAHERWNHKHFEVLCHRQDNWDGGKRTHRAGRFFTRSYVNYILRNDERYQQKARG